jgi:hypothetical protein
MEPSAKKSIAQLEDEKEKKYVTAEVGSSLSGYTKDYLERLCRLDKVEYRLRKNGQYALELSSLLNETHTILVSFEGLTFVDKSDLLVLPSSVSPQAPVGLNAISAKAQAEHIEQPADLEVLGMVRSEVRQTPHFGEFTRAGSDFPEAGNLAFVGRSFVSDPLPQVQREEKDKVKRLEPLVPQQNPPSSLPPPTAALPALSTQGSGASEVKKENNVEKEHETPAVLPEVHEVIKTPVYIPVLRSTPTPPNPTQFVTAIPPTHARKEEFPQATILSPVHIPHQVDDWDALFRAEATNDHAQVPVAPLQTPSLPVAPPVPKYLLSSRYRPVQTSLDPRVHHDEAPLFPVLKPKVLISVMPDVPELPPSPPVSKEETPMPFTSPLPMTSPVHSLMTPEQHLPSKVSRF